MDAMANRATRPSDPALEPDTFGRLRTALAEHGLELGDEIGRGGTAVVYRARDIKHERDVAVKVLRSELAETLSGGRFMREIQLLATLLHPHIVPLFDSGRIGQRLYYVMPFITGETLARRIAREERLPIGDAVAIAREVADALDHAHSQGVVHRDIKPGNILLAAGHAVVADFGIAVAVSRAEAALRGGERVTGAGVGVGTAEYVSPEQAEGRKVLDGRTDIYSLGCVLYEMLVGQPPFVGRNPDEVARRRLSETATSVRERRPEVPEWLDRIVMRALARDPSDRFASARELAVALSVNPAMIPAPASAAPQTGHARPSRRRGLLFGITAAALGASALVFALGRGAPFDDNRIVIADLTNETGDVALDALGRRAAEWITDTLTTYAGLDVAGATLRRDAIARVERQARIRNLAEAARARTVVAGSIHRSRDSLEFRIGITDASTGRLLRSIGPLRSSAVEPEPALRHLRSAVASAIDTLGIAR
jgi:serine/threonine-protein kinase